jgi:hypothetical protein
MNFILSYHAQIQIAKRQLPIYLIAMLAEAPQQIIEEEGGIKVYQSLFDNAGKTQLLRVVVNDSVEPMIVITVYVTSKISKYWRQA